VDWASGHGGQIARPISDSKEKLTCFRFGAVLSAKKREIDHVEPAQDPSMIAHSIEWFSEYEIVMVSAEPKPTPNLPPRLGPHSTGGTVKLTAAIGFSGYFGS
jgi:hypothetical protein